MDKAGSTNWGTKVWSTFLSNGDIRPFKNFNIKVRFNQQPGFNWLREVAKAWTNVLQTVPPAT